MTEDYGVKVFLYLISVGAGVFIFIVLAACEYAVHELRERIREHYFKKVEREKQAQTRGLPPPPVKEQMVDAAARRIQRDVRKEGIVA